MIDKKPNIELLPNIHQYLEQANNNRSVNIENLDEIVYRIHASTGLSLEASEIVLKSFFQEIRNSILRGEVVRLAKLGKFFLSTPKTVKNKKRIFPKFQLYKQLLLKLNNDT
jgi:nucleoid DNA-binding protein